MYKDLNDVIIGVFDMLKRKNLHCIIIIVIIILIVVIIIPFIINVCVNEKLKLNRNLHIILINKNYYSYYFIPEIN